MRHRRGTYVPLTASPYTERTLPVACRPWSRPGSRQVRGVRSAAGLVTHRDIDTSRRWTHGHKRRWTDGHKRWTDRHPCAAPAGPEPGEDQVTWAWRRPLGLRWAHQQGLRLYGAHRMEPHDKDKDPETMPPAASADAEVERLRAALAEAERRLMDAEGRTDEEHRRAEGYLALLKRERADFTNLQATDGAGTRRTGRSSHRGPDTGAAPRARRPGACAAQHARGAGRQHMGRRNPPRRPGPARGAGAGRARTDQSRGPALRSPTPRGAAPGGCARACGGRGGARAAGGLPARGAGATPGPGQRGTGRCRARAARGDVACG